jgi:hypothetical protein
MKSLIVAFVAALAASTAPAAEDGYPPGLFEHSPAVPSGPNDSADSRGPPPDAGGPPDGNGRWTTIAPASPLGPFAILRKSNARMPGATRRRAARRLLIKIANFVGLTGLEERRTGRTPEVAELGGFHTAMHLALHS